MNVTLVRGIEYVLQTRFPRRIATALKLAPALLVVPVFQSVFIVTGRTNVYCFQIMRSDPSTPICLLLPANPLLLFSNSWRCSVIQ